jgi:tRNA(adenine34) deaminase
MPDHEKFMRVALDEARKARSEGNDPYGSVVVRGEIVARGRNLVATTLDPTAHSEVVALREAAKVLGSTNLEGCTLYSTYEPCVMCCGALIASGVSSIVLGARRHVGDPPWGNHTVEGLLEMTGRGSEMQLITGVLAGEGEEVTRVP